MTHALCLAATGKLLTSNKFRVVCLLTIFLTYSQVLVGVWTCIFGLTNGRNKPVTVVRVLLPHCRMRVAVSATGIRRVAASPAATMAAATWPPAAAAVAATIKVWLRCIEHRLVCRLVATFRLVRAAVARHPIIPAAAAAIIMHMPVTSNCCTTAATTITAAAAAAMLP